MPVHVCEDLKKTEYSDNQEQGCAVQTCHNKPEKQVSSV